MESATLAPPGARPAAAPYTFAALVLSQLLSSSATGLTLFGLTVWAFQSTRSATAVSLIVLSSQMPRAFCVIPAGALVDRYGQRAMLSLGNALAAASFAPLLITLGEHPLGLWHVCLAVGMSATCLAGQWPAVSAAVVALFTRQEYGRANGVVQAGYAASGITAPIIGGVLLSRTDIRHVVAIGIGLYALSAVIAAVIRLAPPSDGPAPRATRAHWAEIRDGWSYLRHEPILVRMVMVLGGLAFVATTATVLVKPLMLSVASPAALGTIMSVAALGVLVGSVGVSVLGTAARSFDRLLLLVGMSGLCVMAAGVDTRVGTIGAAVFAYSMLQPVIATGVQAMIQEHAPAHLQGRLHAFTAALTLGVMPLAVPVAGPLADYVFEPLLRSGGPLAGSIGLVIGTGPGRGIGLLLILLGAVTAALATLTRVKLPRAAR